MSACWSSEGSGSTRIADSPNPVDATHHAASFDSDPRALERGSNLEGDRRCTRGVAVQAQSFGDHRYPGSVRGANALARRDRHSLLGGLGGVCQQVASLSPRDEGSVGAVTAIGECLCDRTNPNPLSADERRDLRERPEQTPGKLSTTPARILAQSSSAAAWW